MRNQHPKSVMRSLGTMAGTGIIVGASCLSATAQAELSLAQQPLFLTASVEPNIMFTIDDSGSMRFEVTPDSLLNDGGTFRYLFPDSDDVYGSGGYSTDDPYDSNGIVEDPRFLSWDFNTTYYNPGIRYEPWTRSDGTTYPDADPENAYHNPAATGRGAIDLTSTEDTWDFYPATYYRYSGSGDAEDHANYDRIEIRAGNEPFNGGEDRTDCADPSACTYNEEIQNFANWYTYYRSRGLAARAGIGQAFAPQGGGIRVGFNTLNSGLQRGVRPFEGTDRDDFYDSLYDPDIPNDGTPLREAAQRAGEYFEDQDEPWETNPGGVNDGPMLECRRSYHVLMTDGFYDNNEDVSAGNQDGSSGNTISGPDEESYQYTAEDPFQDNESNTLADVAMRYWKHDLRGDLDNRVPTTSDNPAFWQHMTTLGVGLGVNGSVDPDSAFDAIESGDSVAWWSGTSNENKINDLLHAAVNTRGGFFSAQDPDTFATELGTMLSSIVAEATRSATAAATNSTFAQSGAKIYQARLDAENWTGNLLAYALDEDTGEVLTPGNPEWTAADQLNALSDPAASRSIFTWDGSDGIPFQWGDLTAGMQADLNDNEALLDYLRGSDEDEQANGGSFRNRDNLIGDIVNSAPAYAGDSNFLFSRLPGEEGTSYREWRDSDDYENRPEMVYVGANDGMLHGFDADTGQERMAFVPNAVFNRLPALADPDYTHQYYVDGSPRVIDAYLNDQWRTVLVGSTGAGGRSVFALDITDPDSFTADDILWEFTHQELGYTIGKPTVARLNNGEWVAVFGNGYNSDSHESSLFVVNLESGDLVQHVETGEGEATNPNGMASVTAVDLDADRVTDRFYAGDLHGKMWRFDADSGALSSAQELFRTPTVDGEPQPITVAPEVSGHPDPGSVMVFFGTGKFLEQGDNNLSGDLQVQSFYGVIDDGSTEIERSDLLEQTITNEGSQTFGGVEYPTRTVSQNTYDDNNPEKGWYLNLVYDGNEEGERVLSRATVLGERIRFATFIPSDDPCSGGGRNWLMELDALGGSRLNENVVDLSGDGNLDFGDGAFMVGDGPPVDGSQRGVRGDDGRPRYDTDPSEEEGGFTGKDDRKPGETGRQSWREIR